MRTTSVIVPLTALAIALAGCASDEPVDDAPATTQAGSTETLGTSPAFGDIPATDVRDEGEEVGGDEGAAEGVANADAQSEQLFPDVIGAEAERNGDTWTISATLSSPYDSPERYADAWRVVGPDGTVYGERILTHDHANEQPFTRSESGISIPDDVSEVVIEGRDQENGYGGETYTLALPG